MDNKDINSSEYKTLEYLNETSHSDNSNIQLDAINEKVEKNKIAKSNGELPTIF